MTKREAQQTVSPDDLLKAAVTGTADQASGPDTEVAAATPAVVSRLARVRASAGDLRRFAIPGAALAAGVVLGGGVIGLSRPSALPSDTVAALSTTLDAGRTETARLGTDIAQLHRVIADLRASTDTARKEAAVRSSALGERLAQLDKNLTAKSAALGERLEQVERDQNARIAGLSAQLDRRSAASTPTAVRPEPTQTGSLAETRTAEAKPTEAKLADARPADVKAMDGKPKAAEKPPVIEGWALRDVYEGTAILENRRRRLVEVAPGDMLPGVGRVEGVERRGREWVVVTRVGLVTPQPW